MKNLICNPRKSCFSIRLTSVILAIFIWFSVIPSVLADYGTQLNTNLYTIDGHLSTETIKTGIADPYFNSYGTGLRVAGKAAYGNEEGTTNVVIKTIHDMKNTEQETSGHFLFRSLKDVGLIATPTQIWEIKIKLPSVTAGGYTDLFHYSDINNNSGFTGTVAAVRLKNGGVYATSLSANDSTVNPEHYQSIIPDGTMNAGEWYKIVRVMDFGSYSRQNMQKIYVYRKNVETGNFDVLLGNTSNWQKTGNLVNASILGFWSRGYGTAEEVLFDDLKLYNTTAMINSIKIDGASGNKIVQLDGSGADYKFIGKFTPYPKAKYNRYQIDVKLTDTSLTDRNNIDAELKLFSLKHDNFTIDNPIHAPIMIKGGKVYATYDSNRTAGSYPIYKTDNVTPLVLEAGKWYTIKAEGDVTTGAFAVYVYDAQLTLLGSKTDILKPVNTANNDRGFTLAAVKGYDKPIYLDNYSYNGWSDRLDGTAVAITPAADLNVIDSCAEDTDYQYALQPNTAYRGTLGVAKVIYETYLQTGVTKTVAPPTIRLGFNGAVDPETFTKQTVLLTQNGGAVEEYSVSYDTTTNVGSIVFGNLHYDRDYVLKITSGIKTTAYNISLLPSYNFTFSTTGIVGDVLLKDADGNVIDANSPLAVGDAVKASAKLSNGSASGMKYLLVLAIYKDDQLKGIRVNDGALTSGAMDEPIDTETFETTEEGCRAEIMVWNDWSSMIPMTSVRTFPNNK